MPQVKPGETQSEFIKRCIPYLIKEGKHPNTAKGRKQAAGECYGIWRNKNKSDEKIPVKSGLVDKKGHFCKVENSENKYYYDIGKPTSKKEALKKAEKEWLDLEIERILKYIEKDSITVGTTVIYEGKLGKVFKVLK